eukprot:jgi/Botrbrau1/5314/Bobra.0391s0026.1
MHRSPRVRRETHPVYQGTAKQLAARCAAADVTPAVHDKSSSIKQVWRKPVNAKDDVPSPANDDPVVVYDSSRAQRQKAPRAHRRRTTVTKHGLRPFRVAFHRRRHLQSRRLSDGISQAPLKSSRSGLNTTQIAGSAKEILAPSKAFPFLPEGHLPDGLHKPIGLIVASAYTLATACLLSGYPPGPAAATGLVVGGLYAALNRYGMKRFWRSPRAPLNVVVTGGARGIGKAMAREFLMAGDRVMITGRTPGAVRKALSDLREEVGEGCWVSGLNCEVTSPASVERLADAAQSQMGQIDVWINNAGCSGSFKSFLDAEPEQIQTVVTTNLMGSLLCTRAALRRMAGQERGGHIFMMDGAGADGLPTPQYAAYGATKAGIAHLMGSLQEEAQMQGLPVGIHTLSPGMVLTDLLLEGATDVNKQIFNVLCEHPETVAAFLVPRARTVAARGGMRQYIRYLTLPRALLRFLTAPLRVNKYFDANGNLLYESEKERILGQRARRTARLAEQAARRTRGLALAYSLSIAASYLIIVSDSMHVL